MKRKCTFSNVKNDFLCFSTVLCPQMPEKKKKSHVAGQLLIANYLTVYCIVCLSSHLCTACVFPFYNIIL